MDKLRFIGGGVDVSPIHWALQSNPWLWNQHRARTESIQSPHYGLDDIWCRFGDPNRATDGQPHESKWYPSADVLGVKPYCEDLLTLVGGNVLGGVLITRIPPGKVCKPHIDDGWHARQYEKYAVQITSAPGQRFCFSDVQLESRPGDVYWFDNQFTHWVVNPTEYERVTMIVCIQGGKSCRGL